MENDDIEKAKQHKKQEVQSAAWTNTWKKWKIEFLSDKKDLPEKTDRSAVRFPTVGSRRIFEEKRGLPNYFDLSPPAPAQIPSAASILFLRRRICARLRQSQFFSQVHRSIYFRGRR